VPLLLDLSEEAAMSAVSTRSANCDEQAMLASMPQSFD